MRPPVHGGEEPISTQTGRERQAPDSDPLERLEREIAECQESQLAELARQIKSSVLGVVERRERVYRRLLVLADALALLAAMLIAFPLLGGEMFKWGALALVPVMVMIAKAQGLYDRDELVIRKSTLDELLNLVNLSTLTALGVWVARGALTGGDPRTVQLFVLWFALTSALVSARILARKFARRLSAVERCLVVGDETLLDQLEAKLEDAPHAQLAGVLRGPCGGLSVDVLRAIALSHNVHRLIISLENDMSEQEGIDLVRTAKATGLRVSLFPRVVGAVTSSGVFDEFGGLTLLGVPCFGLSRSSRAAKRTFDLLGAGMGLLLCAPLMIPAALIIKLQTPGPVFFRQTRVGRDGKRFQMLKFRSMVDGADAQKSDLLGHNESEGLFKIGDDPRITRVGGLLRRTYLDELPQLINVLRGEMSLVGPRPLVVDEDERITGFDRRRLHLTPGMTGPWQILGPTRVSLPEMLKIDYVYVAHWSLWRDIKIVLQTCGVILNRKGL
jgi:exopolysaccharide biosynthesis polyprenyl glycosylphosphotransferase